MDKSRLVTGTTYAWYTTIVIDREVHDEPRAEVIRSPEQEMLASTNGFLDLLVARLAIGQGRSFYAHGVMDRIVLLLPNRSPLAVPNFRATFTPTTVADPAAFPREVVTTLSESAKPAYGSLWRPCHWYLQSLREADPFKRFFWAFFAVECFINDLARRFQVWRAAGDPTMQEQTRSLLREAGVAPDNVDFTRRTPLLNLALLLPRLSVSDAPTRLRGYQALKAFRGGLAHGRKADETQLREHTDSALPWIESLLAAAIRVLASEPLTAR